MSDIYNPLTLKVLEAYSSDIGRGVARIDHNSLDSLSLSEGDCIEIIDKDRTIEAKCLALLPSDEGKSIIRVDPHLRKSIGVSIGKTIVIRSIKLDAQKNEIDSSREEEEALGKTPTKLYNKTASMIIISGSCIDFEKERPKIMDFIGTLEIATHMKSQCKCSDFVEKLSSLYPDIDKQEGNLIEQRFVLWLDKQMKKRKLEYHLKLREIPFEVSKGFRLNPKNYRDDSGLEELR